MLYRFTILLAAAMALCGGLARAQGTPTYQPEVLLMKSIHDGGQQWFEYAKLKPAVTAGSPATAVFRYRADIDVVTCTIEAKPTGTNGEVVTKVTLQRKGTDPDGHEVTSTTSQDHVFKPGEAIIVGTNPRVLPDGHSKNVEILQLTLSK
jgi:hypothetical protein